MRNGSRQPRGELSLRTVAMQANTNQAGDIFDGWIMYLMNQAADIAARARADGHIATASVTGLNFVHTVKVGDVVCVYTNITKIGHTSITVQVEVYALRQNQGKPVLVTAAEFVVVAVDDHRMPRTLPVAA